MNDVRLSGRAQAGLAAILDYLYSAAGAKVARTYASRFDYHFDQLATFPGIGTLRPDVGKSVRILVESPYLIFYQSDELGVFVLRILDGRRRITRKLVVEGRG